MGSSELFAVLATVAGRLGHDVAIVDGFGPVPYRDLAGDAEDMAVRLRAIGVAAGDRVAVTLPSDRRLVSALFAAWSLDAVAALVPPDLSAQDEATIMSILRPKATVVAEARGPGAVIHHRGQSGRVGPLGTDGDDTALVLYTSGTTGRPKGIVHSTQSLLSAVCITAAVQAEALGQEVSLPGDRAGLQRTVGGLVDQRLGLTLLTGMPLWTMAGYTTMQRALFMGESLVVPTGSDPEVLWSFVERAPVTTLSLSAFMAQRLAHLLRARRPGASTVAMVGIGAGPTPASLPPRLEGLLECVVSVGYGTTELGGPALMGRMSDPPEVRWRTVGSPLPGVEARLSRLDPASEVGVLQCRTPSLMSGYVDPADGPGVDGDGWFDTGDVATVTDEGHWQILGRRSGFIVRGGRNIDPVSLEQHLESHDQVAEAAVVGVPGAVAGEQDIVAAVVAADGVGSIDVGGLRRHCRERFPAVSVPRRFVTLESIPRTTDGGIMRHEVRSVIDSRS